MADSGRIVQAAQGNAGALTYEIQPTDIESLLGYQAPSKHKPVRAFERVGDLHANGGLPPAFVAAMNMVYFGTTTEPA